ncbi:symmetrical bis(5'-nucleosyl)-tetraphosphatase [Pseudaestuariivita rosea]|uniref:symmetrical bis(5'-nucleosyl)-tetraphosphatase n=1 Tax=Pseudaestuariivita rosea TaxID=2763263 RepID=UPI001ABB4B4E
MSGYEARSFVIGDVHGCLLELRQLVRKIQFRPRQDRLIFVGDLVGRGPFPLETLEYVRDLGSMGINIMGNHDLALLARGTYEVDRQVKAVVPSGHRATDTARRWSAVLDWLGRSPFIYNDAPQKVVVSHAGIPPQFAIDTAIDVARGLERKLRKSARHVARSIDRSLSGRFETDDTTSASEKHIGVGCTRIRYCRTDGSMAGPERELSAKAAQHLVPWSSLRNHASDNGRTIVHGHWAALGIHMTNNALCIDDGCVFGGRLVAVELSPGLPITWIRGRRYFNLRDFREKWKGEEHDLKICMPS